MGRGWWWQATDQVEGGLLLGAAKWPAAGEGPRRGRAHLVVTAQNSMFSQGNLSKSWEGFAA